MGTYNVRHAMDMKNTSLGTITTGEDGLIEKWEPVDKGQLPLMAVDKRLQWNIGQTRAYHRNLIVEEKTDVAKVVAVEEDVEVETREAGEIVKTDPARQHVFGWAYVTHDVGGEVNVDKSGDFVDTVEEIEKSAYDFVLKSRKGDADHTNVHGADMIESVVFTPEKIEKMGIPEGTVPLGWWVGFHVNDADTWARVERKELTSFSVHGKGTRAKIAE